MEGNGNKKIRQARSLAGKHVPRKMPKPADPREHRPYVKKPGHANTKYNEEMKAKAEYCGMMGFGLQQTADFLEVSAESLRNYRRQYPDFDLAVRRGILLANAKVVRKLFQMATEKGDVAACKYWLQSRGGTSWSRDEGQRTLIGDIIMPGGQKTVNTVVMGVVEIIQRRVRDKETVALIAQDIRELAERQSGRNGDEQQTVEGEVIDAVDE